MAEHYAGRASYDGAVAATARYRSEPWFPKVTRHAYWDTLAPDGEPLAPDALAATIVGPRARGGRARGMDHDIHGHDRSPSPRYLEKIVAWAKAHLPAAPAAGAR